MSYRSVSPYSGKILKTFEELTDKQLESALDTAESCFQVWRHTTFAERAVIVAKAATLMRKRSDELAGFVTLEMGKLINQARGEVASQREYHRLLRQERRKAFSYPASQAELSGEAQSKHAPFGVLFGVQPWNFPYYQLARFAAPISWRAMSVMVKHAGCVPQCAIAFEQLWLDAGAPGEPIPTFSSPMIRSTACRRSPH